MSEKNEIIYVDDITKRITDSEIAWMLAENTFTAYILKSKFDLLEAENQKLKAELEKVKGRSNRKLSDRFTEILNKFTEEEIQRWIDFDANRMNAKTK